MPGTEHAEDATETRPPQWERESRESPHEQLLTEIPPTDYHRGGLAGYDAGRRIRRGLAIFAACAVFCSVCAYVLAVRHAAWERAHPFVLPEGTDLSTLTRTLVWNEGRARFALDREPPGVEKIVLPDRSLTLAEGSVRAQVVVVVEEGVTTEIEVLSGHVAQALTNKRH